VIRNLVLGFAAVAATLLGGAGAALLASSKAAAPAPAEAPVHELVKLDAVSVPVIRRGQVQGYVVAQVAVEAAAVDMKNSKPVLAVYASEAVFRAVYEEEAFDFSGLRPAHLAALADRMTKLANERIGRAAIKRVAIESINYVTEAQARGGQRR
jgi:hypothetical protein